jgi:hypothetical protein
VSDVPTKICGNCKHWGTGHEGSGPPAPEESSVEEPCYRPCGAVLFDDRYRANQRYDKKEFIEEYEDLTPELQAEIDAVRKHKAVTQDGSGYHAALKTREDFGCVLWEEHVEEPAGSCPTCGAGCYR